MRNPIEDLGKPRMKNPKGQPWSGVFSCQEDGCYEVVIEARYIEEAKILTWICPEEHISKIEGFQID